MTIGFLAGKLCVEKCWADVPQTLLCCPVAALLSSNHSQVKALQGWQGEWEATAGSHSGRTSYFLMRVQELLSRYSNYSGLLSFLPGEKYGSELPPWSTTRNDFVHFIHLFGGSLGPTLQSEDSLLALKASALTRQQH